MPITDPDDLNQGGATAVSDAVWGSPTGNTVTITSAGTNLPTIGAGDFFEVRNHSNVQNNGLYKESGGTPTTGSITADKVSGANPVAAASEAVDTLGTTTTPKSVFYDTNAFEVYLLEQGSLDAEGITGAAIYAHMVISWQGDQFLMDNAPFPMTSIDTDAGKYFIGVDPSGNNNGWNWADNVTYSIRTRKLLRSMGWSEVDSAGITQAVWANITSLGGFEDPANDAAYYMLGSDTTVDNTVDFDFAGPVNESIECFTRLADGAINGGTGVTISADGRTMTRSDSGNWRTDGFLVGGQIGLRDSENSTNNGTFLLSAVQDATDGAITMGTDADTATGFDFVDGGGGNDSIVRNDGGSWIAEGYFVGGNVTVANATTVANDGTYIILAVTASTIQVATASLTADTGDQTATFGPLDATGSPDTTVNASIDNRNKFSPRLRVRDADPTGKTYSQSSLAAAGETALSNKIHKFGLSNASDPKITNTDAFIDSNLPYTGMTITFHTTPQSLGGGGELVGGPYNFGIVIDGNNGLDSEVYEFVQRELRRNTDIDDTAVTAIGRAIDGLMRFNGDNLEVGSVDGGASFPTNPYGGGPGVYITNLNSLSKNTTTYRDNTGAVRGHPIGTPVTIDFNDVITNAPTAVYALFFDYTIRTTVSDLVITAGTGAVGTFDSAGANLPATLDAGVGAYVRITGYTGADAAMNGIYQVTALTSTSQWDVIRQDNETIVTTASASIPIDEHAVDTPDAVIVEDNLSSPVSGSVGGSDKSFTFDYSNNAQGGRTPGTDAQVIAKAISAEDLGTQYARSAVQTVESGTTLTIPVSGQLERNFSNP